jgi:hypothetical protein
MPCRACSQDSRKSVRNLLLAEVLGLLLCAALLAGPAGAQPSRTTTEAINSAVQSAVQSARDQVFRDAREARAQTRRHEARLRHHRGITIFCCRERPEM